MSYSVNRSEQLVGINMNREFKEQGKSKFNRPLRDANKTNKKKCAKKSSSSAESFMQSTEKNRDLNLISYFLKNNNDGNHYKIAEEIYRVFGGFVGFMSAPNSSLMKINGLTSDSISNRYFILEAAAKLAFGRIVDRPVLSLWDDLIAYLTISMAHEKREQFRILFLDKKNRLIADEVQQTGTVDHTPVYIREVVKRALEVSATAIILVHNHPSGDATPSRAGIDMTRLIVQAGKPLSVLVHDHIIICRDGHASLKGLGLM
jgi:DNA repair protein RadC